MIAIFLDFDGVVNDHKPHPNGYCGLNPECVANMTRILERCPSARIVVSSAWRYIVSNGDMTLRGLEYLFMIFGAPYDVWHQRIVAITETDEATTLELGIRDEDAELDYLWLKENGCELRSVQIERAAERLGVTRFAVLDDLHLPGVPLFKTDGLTGLTQNLADRVVDWLNR